MSIFVAVGPHSPIGYNDAVNAKRRELLQLARIPPSAITALRLLPPSLMLQLARIPPSAITVRGDRFAQARCSWPAFPHRL